MPKTENEHIETCPHCHEWLKITLKVELDDVIKRVEVIYTIEEWNE